VGWLVVGLALAGLVIAVTFAAAFYRPGSAVARLLPPELCGLAPGGAGAESGSGRRDLVNPGCETVIHTPGARVFGIPNSVLGAIYYLAAMTTALLDFPPALATGLLAAAWLAVALGVYLGYRLLRVERMSCRLCWTAHALNAVLAIVLTASYYRLPAG
jgi:hypothetical protein